MMSPISAITWKQKSGSHERFFSMFDRVRVLFVALLRKTVCEHRIFDLFSFLFCLISTLHRQRNQWLTRKHVESVYNSCILFFSFLSLSLFVSICLAFSFCLSQFFSLHTEPNKKHVENWRSFCSGRRRFPAFQNWMYQRSRLDDSLRQIFVPCFDEKKFIVNVRYDSRSFKGKHRAFCLIKDFVLLRFFRFKLILMESRENYSTMFYRTELFVLNGTRAC